MSYLAMDNTQEAQGHLFTFLDAKKEDAALADKLTYSPEVGKAYNNIVTAYNDKHSRDIGTKECFRVDIPPSWASRIDVTASSSTVDLIFI